MNNFCDGDKLKKKNKTIVEKFVNFANNTIKKKDGKNQKELNIENENKISNKNNKGQKCKEKQEFIFYDEYSTDLKQSNDNVNNLEIVENIQPNSIMSCNDTCTNNLILSNQNEEYLDYTSQNILFSDTDVNSYTFSTGDFPTIKPLINNIPTIPNDTADIDVISIQKCITNSMPDHRNSAEDFSKLPKDLRRMIDIFNHNDQGLFIELNNDQIMGKLRVFINLLRPINMLLTARPPSSFDMFLEGDTDGYQSTMDRAYYNREVVFHLPRGTTKLLYININCPTIEVISILLTKFNIQNNPKRFALYEQSMTASNEVEVRKLGLCQCPLKMMLEWCKEDENDFHKNLASKRFVLQENDYSSVIEWNEFSVHELKSFLIILNEEEEELKNEVIAKYDSLRSDIGRYIAGNIGIDVTISIP